MILTARKLVAFDKAYGGQPVPFGTERMITTPDAVVNFGRFASYGDFVTRILAKLNTGEIVQLTYADQTPEAARWLRGQLRTWKAMPNPSRSMPWGTCWRTEE